MNNVNNNGPKKNVYEQILEEELKAYGLKSDYKLVHNGKQRLQHIIIKDVPRFRFWDYVLLKKVLVVGEITVEPKLRCVKEKPGLAYGALEFRVLDNGFKEHISSAIGRVTERLARLQ